MTETLNDKEENLLVGKLTTEQARQESEANLQFALTAAQLGIWNLDPATGMVYFDERCKQLFGNPPDADLNYDNIIQHIHIEDRENVITAVSNAIDPAKRSLYDVRYRTIGASDKILRWLHCTGKAYFGENGEPYRLAGVSRNITEDMESENRLRMSEERYKQLASELEIRVEKRTQELHLANQELVISNSNLQQFAYAASHDMQEPLRKILSFSSRLQTVYSGALDENAAFMLNRIQDASRRMSSMIDDLLAYSRLTTRDSAFEEVDLNEIVSAVTADLEFSIEEQKSEINVRSLPTVWGSPSQLTQLVQNLLSNAIKYRKRDVHSLIEIQAQELERSKLADIPRLLPQHDYICLQVKDNGIGFDEKYLDRIFQMFQRLHGRGEFSGSGIGLALCKKVVQNHHGYITAKSEPEIGSTFLVYLPKPQAS